MTSPYTQRGPGAGGVNRDEVMSDVNRWPDSGNEQQGGAPSSSSSSNQSQERLKSGNRLPRELREQLTPEEVALFNNVRQKTQICMAVGIAGGFLLGRRLGRRATATPAKLAWLASGCAAGATVGTIAATVLGVKEMQRINNPQHLRGILQTAIDMKEGRPPVGPPAPRQGQGRQRQGPGSSWGDESMSDGARGASTDRYESMRGDFGQGQSTSYSESNTAPAGQGLSSQGNVGQGQEQGQEQKSSRWQQLRANNATSASTWEKIRQDNAREAYNARRAGQNQQQQSSQGQFSQQEPSRARQSYQGMADPTFGKGASPMREQSQREYQASFERERRGIDG